MLSPLGNRRLRWLIVGSGQIAKRHVECIIAAGTPVELSRLSSSGRPPTDPSIDANMEIVHTSWADALAWRPDAAIVANAATAHAEAVRALVDMGVPVLVEKPLSTDEDEALSLVDLVKRAGIPVLVGYCLRHHRSVAHVFDVVSSGRLGTLLQCVLHVGQHIDDWRPTPSEESVSLRPELGGGALFELSHEIDLALSLIGTPEKVAASMTTVDGWNVETVATILLSNGCSTASVTLNMHERPARRTLILVGSNGSLSADLISGNVVEQFGTGNPVQYQLSDNGQMYHRQIEHFIRCVNGAETPMVTVEDGALVIACIERARVASADWVR